MIIHSIKLHNIRSYLDAEIQFPEGSILLAGDIGSGKSTILLAIEFCLFGTRRIDLSGASLLRHGTKEGSAELHFSVHGKPCRIKRVLKKGKNGISQEAGYFIVNDQKKEGTAIELKAWILELLGYPSDIVSKSKDLIFRYTVYTPQEQMKQIIFADPDVRLNTLRTVFQFDKYKRIRDNVFLVLKELRDRSNVYEGNISDLATKIGQQQEQSLAKEKIRKTIKKIEPELKGLKEQLDNEKNILSTLEKDIALVHALQKEIEVVSTSIIHKADEVSSLQKQTAQLKGEVGQLSKETFEFTDETDRGLQDALAEGDVNLNKLDNQLIEIQKQASSFQVKKQTAEEVKQKIAQLNQCPTCEQDVGEEHKHSIRKREDVKIDAFIKQLEGAVQEQKSLSADKGKQQQILEELRKKLQTVSLLRYKIKEVASKKQQVGDLITKQEAAKKEMGVLNSKKMSITEKLKPLTDISKIYEQQKKKVDTLGEREHSFALQHVSLQKEQEGIEQLLSLLSKEIEHKNKQKEALQEINQLRHWFSQYLLSLIGTIERHVMRQVHLEFNEYFQQWFSVLMEDETISVRLDEQFTPVIEQNGYDTTIAHLSGGEKTAVALAYRLALNKVINHIVGHLATKDVLILDEPTDGFSTEQIDKMRDVLDQLKVKQVILVSHDHKIESFVNSVIHISKQDHVSAVTL